MFHLVSIKEEDTKTLQSYMNLPGVKGKGSFSENYLMIEASFEAQNQAEYNNLKIKAADITVREITLIDNTPFIEDSEELEEESYNSSLISSGSEQTLEVSNTLPLFLEKSIEGIYSDSNYIGDAKSKIKKFAYDIKVSLSHTTVSKRLYIEEGKIISEKQFYYHNTENQIDLNEVFFGIRNQASLNSQISPEIAKVIYDRIYITFPILSSSLPIISTITYSQTNIKDILLSRTYSNYPDLAKEAVSLLSDSYQTQGQLFKDMLAVICLGIAKGKNDPNAPVTLHFTSEELSLQNFLLDNLDLATLVVERKDPLKIIHTTSQEDLTIAAIKDSVAGAYKTEFNTVIFINDTYRLVHELLGHAAANILFLNNANPYFKEKEEALNKALINILNKVYKDIEKPEDNLQTNNLFLIHNKLFSSPTLALITAAHTPGIQNFKEFFNQINVFSKYTITKAHNKYFAEKSFEEVKEEDLISATTQEIENLQLDPIDLHLIKKIGTLIFHYGFEDMSREIFATMLELFYEYPNNPKVNNFFAPIEATIAEEIHQLVEEQLIIPHQLECSGKIDTNNFSYCVEEFLR